MPSNFAFRDGALSDASRTAVNLANKAKLSLHTPRQLIDEIDAQLAAATPLVADALAANTAAQADPQFDPDRKAAIQGQWGAAKQFVADALELRTLLVAEYEALTTNFAAALGYTPVAVPTAPNALG
ncbi:MAG: hypothetical protein KDA05_12405 [Phycisphaerales bacterium]|nr:hypothetical protein [Phycisphaerales bacterium]